VAHIRNIADVANLIAQILKEAEQDVIGNPGTGMAQMGVSIHGGAADIHAGVALVNGFEQFLVMGKSIG
jgi:hypothetical protein